MGWGKCYQKVVGVDLKIGSNILAADCPVRPVPFVKLRPTCLIEMGSAVLKSFYLLREEWYCANYFNGFVAVKCINQ